jgi:hypothetical protein
MDELTKVWQVWNRTKLNSLECDTHKNVRVNRVKTVEGNDKKTKSNEKCVQSLLTSNRKISLLGKLLISKRNRKQKSAVKAVANGVHTAAILETESHLPRRQRERLALMAADMWV